MRHARALQVRMLYVGRLQKERHFKFERGNPTQLEESLFMPPTIRMIVGLWEGLEGTLDCREAERKIVVARSPP